MFVRMMLDNTIMISNTRLASIVEMKEYVDTGLRVMAGVMLAMTGVFLFEPELAENFFPWLAE